MDEKVEHSIPSFNQRFNLKVDSEEAQKKFINRAINMIEGAIPELEVVDSVPPSYVRTGLISVATKLGVPYNWTLLFHNYAEKDFYSCLLSLESLYQAYASEYSYRDYADRVSRAIQYTLSLSEIDLGIEWRNGVFWPSGAKLLDEELVNENLKWLSEHGYNDVIVPFEKGLRDFLEARNKPERLGDTVTDIYEALEALAKIVTGKDTDLSGNAELFISNLKLNEYYKALLKNHIDYACEYRHAAKLGKGKKPLKHSEVEAFVYLTGLFMRLAIQQLSTE